MIVIKRVEKEGDAGDHADVRDGIEKTAQTEAGGTVRAIHRTLTGEQVPSGFCRMRSTPPSAHAVTATGG